MDASSIDDLRDAHRSFAKVSATTANDDFAWCSMKQPSNSVPNPEPRWPALLAILTAALLFGALPSYLAAGPQWLVILLVGVLEVPAIFSHWRGYHRANVILGFAASGVLTLFLIWSVALLVISLPMHKEAPVQLLVSALILWTANVLVFALWYWRLDAGGPARREARSGHTEGAFLFPQMAMKHTSWSPRFVDYLFLSFNTSTALSPTDAPILSRWAKVLVMIQAAIAMTTVVLLAARAVNIM